MAKKAAPAKMPPKGMPPKGAGKMPMKGEHMMAGMPMKDAAMKGMMTGKGKNK